MIKEAIILAGGLGTRLQEAVPELPKCMAPVAGRPFLFYVINYWRSQGITKFIFSLGYKHEYIETYLNENFSTLQYACVIEPTPLGTGGAILLASQQATEKNCLVTNGDTLFKADLSQLYSSHNLLDADCTIALKQMKQFDRYGVVEIDSHNKVTNFKEKQFYEEGLINAGVYVLNTERFCNRTFPEIFSFETKYLEQPDIDLYGIEQDGYFIDIGIPADYQQAQKDLAKPALDLSGIDKSWTLFIDRDGVINHEKKGDYILNWRDFIFYDGVRECFPQLNARFGKIIIITNQRGVGKALMTEEALRKIHQHMITQLAAAGGHIDNIYYCTSTNNFHPERKPNPGMTLLAKSDYPELDFSKSIMIGNKPSDMLFGRNSGIYTVFVATTNPEIVNPHPDIDLRFASLPDFTKAL